MQELSFSNDRLSLADVNKFKVQFSKLYQMVETVSQDLDLADFTERCGLPTNSIARNTGSESCASPELAQPVAEATSSYNNVTFSIPVS